MNPTSEDIKDLLAGETSLGLEYATNLFVNEIPEDATRPAVGIYAVPGETRDLAVDIETPYVQIRVEGAAQKSVAAEQLLIDVCDFLHGQHNVTQGGARYLVLQVVSEIMLVAWDERNRPIFSAQLKAMRTPA